MAREEETGGKGVWDAGRQVRREELPVGIHDYWEEEKFERRGWRAMRGGAKETDTAARTWLDGPAEGWGDAGAGGIVEGAGTRGRGTRIEGPREDGESGDGRGGMDHTSGGGTGR